MYCLWLSMAVVWGMTVLLYCFRNNFKWISIINGYSNCTNRRKKRVFLRKYCILHVVKQLKIYDFGEMLPTNCLKKNFFNQKSSRSKIYAFPKAILHECQRSCKFLDNSMYCIWLCIVFICGEEIFFGFFVNKGKMGCKSSPQNLDTKSRQSVS